MRATPRDLGDSSVWLRSSLAVRMLYLELRPSRGDRILAWPARLSAVDVFQSVVGAHRVGLTSTEATETLSEFVEVGFAVLAEPVEEQDGTITIPSLPAAVLAARARRAEGREQERQARYASLRGKFGGLSDAERQDRRRKGLATPRQPVVGDAAPARDVPASAPRDVTDNVTGGEARDVARTAAHDVTENVTAEGAQLATDSGSKIRDVTTPSTRAPAPTPTPPQPPSGGLGAAGERGHDPGRDAIRDTTERRIGDRRLASAAPAPRLAGAAPSLRTAADLERLGEREVGTLAFREWGRAPKVFTTGGPVARKHCGRLVLQAGLGEADVVLLGEHWRAEPALALEVMRTAIGRPRATTIDADYFSAAALGAALESARAWRRGAVPGPARASPPVVPGRAADGADGR